MLGDDGGAGAKPKAPRRPSGGAKAAAAPAKPAGGSATPGPSFWTWTPPEQSAPPPGLQPQLARAAAKREALPVRERTAESLALPLQSDVEAPSWQEALLTQMMAAAPPEQTDAATAEARPAEASADARATLATAMAQAAAGGPAEASGVMADGTRWWSESGVEELAGGKQCRWTVLRGVSADGSKEWQEKWWETSDAVSYRELGAEKSGRDSTGRVWRDAWTEIYAPDAVTGIGHIRRDADKWATAPDGATWHEEWREAFWSDGRTERDAAKWGALGPGVIAEDGHASTWTEKWGEKWDGQGGCSKWTDKWAERREREGGGLPRRWGDKWTQEFRYGGVGGRWGETWSEDPGGAGNYSRKWSEDHYGTGEVRKWGQASDGEGWDVTQREDTWYEGVANVSWNDAYTHSPQLLGGAPGWWAGWLAACTRADASCARPRAVKLRDTTTLPADGPNVMKPPPRKKKAPQPPPQPPQASE